MLPFWNNWKDAKCQIAKVKLCSSRHTSVHVQSSTSPARWSRVGALDYAAIMTSCILLWTHVSNDLAAYYIIENFERKCHIPLAIIIIFSIFIILTPINALFTSCKTFLYAPSHQTSAHMITLLNFPGCMFVRKL